MHICHIQIIYYTHTHSNCVYTHTYTSICINISPRQQDATQWPKLLWPSLVTSGSAREATKEHPGPPKTSPAEELEHRFQRGLLFTVV